MPKPKKTLEKILQRPTPSGVKWSEITALLTFLGYAPLKNRKTGGSRRKFYNKKIDSLISLHEPHPQPTVDKGALSDLIEKLKDDGFIK